MASESSVTVQFHASDMVLNIHPDASYLSETRTRSKAEGQFMFGSKPVNREPIKMNGAVYMFSGILNFIFAKKNVLRNLAHL